MLRQDLSSKNQFFKLDKIDANESKKEELKVDCGWVVELRQYTKENYNYQLSGRLLKQLALFQGNSIKTSESNVRLTDKKDDSLHIEIKRSLSRRNCLHLLIDGSEEAYKQFISTQNKSEALAYSTFKYFSEYLASQSQSAKEVLEASCFIAVSDQAKILAKQKNAIFSYDSEKFLTDTIKQCPDIYPIVGLLTKQAKNLLSFIYLANSHARHMLYTEGGNNMFAVLKENIISGSLTKEQFDLWLSRWIINIAGFRGHEAPLGSIYLTEKTAQAVIMLQEELSKLFDNPNYDALNGYLQKRAEQLGVKSLYLAHLGCSMRLYSANEGKVLQDWFNQLSQTTQTQLEESYQKTCSTMKTTPTYEVAVMDNLRAMGLSIAETLDIASLISTAATNIYKEGIKQGKIEEKTPLCFRDVAFKENLEIIIKTYRESGSIPPITVNEQGAVEKLNQDYNPKHILGLVK